MLDGVRIQKFVGESPISGGAIHAFWISGPEWIDAVNQMTAWCTEQHGPPGEVWHMRQWDSVIWFTDEVHAFEFRMRWM